MDNSTQLVRAALIVAGAAALIYWLGWCWREGHGWARSAVKSASVAALAVAGWAQGAPDLVVAGLALGAVGDLALSRPGDRAFLVGMVAFAFGHLAYAALFLAAGPLVLTAPRMVAMVALIGGALSTSLWLLPRTGALAPAVAGYVTVICLMGVAALTLHAGLPMAGAALFILSDVALAVALFLPVSGGEKRALALALWPAYWVGQALILNGSRFL